MGQVKDDAQVMDLSDRKDSVLATVIKKGEGARSYGNEFHRLCVV